MRDPAKDLIIIDDDSTVKDLSIPQWRAAQMYVMTGDTRKAADEAGVTPSTIRIWLKSNEPFKQAIKDLLDAARSELKIEMTLGISEAIDKLRDLMDEDAKGISLGACKAMVDAAKKIDIRTVETVETEETFIADEDDSKSENMGPSTMKEINKVLRTKRKITRSNG